MTPTTRYLALLLSAIPLFAQQEVPGEKTIDDRSIKPLYVEELKYPELPRQARIQGVVVIRAKLDSQGNVVSSAGISGHPLLAKDCLPNSLKWRFEPNSENAVVIIYNFRIDEGMRYSRQLPCLSVFSFRRPNFATITTGPPPVNI